MESTVEIRAMPAPVGLLLAGAIAGDLLSPIELPVSWADGLPRVTGLVFEQQLGADRWPSPESALKQKRVDCAAMVRVYGLVWGSHVGVSPVAEGKKMHAVLFEDGEMFDPSRAHGARYELPPSAFVLTPISRPSQRLGELAANLAARVGLELPRDMFERLAFAAQTGDADRLRAVARRWMVAGSPQQPVLNAVAQLLDAPGMVGPLLRGSTRIPTAIAALFVTAVRPAAMAAALLPAEPSAPPPRVAPVTQTVALEGFAPGCPGGCSIFP